MSTKIVGVTLDEALLLGTTYLASEDYDAAMEAYLAALRLEPTSTEALIGLAKCLAARGDNERASATLQGAGEQLVKTKQYGLALEVYSRAAKLTPHRLGLQLEIAELEAKTGETQAATIRVQALAQTHIAEEKRETFLEFGMAMIEAATREFVTTWSRNLRATNSAPAALQMYG